MRAGVKGGVKRNTGGIVAVLLLSVVILSRRNLKKLNGSKQFEDNLKQILKRMY